MARKRSLPITVGWVVLCLIVSLFAFSFVPRWMYTSMHSNKPHGKMNDELTGYWLNDDRTSYYPLLRIKPDGEFRAGAYTTGVWHVSSGTVNLDRHLFCGTGNHHSLFPEEFIYTLSGEELVLTSGSDDPIAGTYRRFDPNAKQFLQEILDELYEPTDVDSQVYALYLQQTLAREDAWPFE